MASGEDVNSGGKRKGLESQGTEGEGIETGGGERRGNVCFGEAGVLRGSGLGDAAGVEAAREDGCGKVEEEDMEGGGGLQSWDGGAGREAREEEVDESSQDENLVAEVPDDLAEGQGVVVSEFHRSAVEY